MPRSGSFRKHQEVRGKQRARRVIEIQSRHIPGMDTSAKAIGKLAANRKPCSCHMCGNPRRHFKALTRQEELAGQRLREQVRDLETPAF